MKIEVAMKRCWRLFLLLVLVDFVPAAFAGQPLQTEIFSHWHQQDLCYTNATKAHPDRTAASLAARNKAIDDCFKAHGLPPRHPQADASAAVTAPQPSTSH
jgi:hypothetical protein